MMQALGCLLATLATAACFRLAENRIPNSCSTQSGIAGETRHRAQNSQDFHHYMYIVGCFKSKTKICKLATHYEI